VNGRDIRVDLTLPVVRIGFGPFRFDPIEQLIGAPVVDLVEPLLAGPVTTRPSAAGPALEVFPLRLPDGEGASIPLGPFGELGFYNAGGRLVLTVPRAAESWIAQRFAGAIVEGPEDFVTLDSVRVVRFVVRLRPGMRATWPLGALGEVGIEAA
jgi:hypothetical protein